MCSRTGEVTVSNTLSMSDTLIPKNQRTVSTVSPALTHSTFDRSNVEINQKFYDQEVEKILDDKLRHVTITRDIIRQNNPSFNRPKD